MGRLVLPWHEGEDRDPDRSPAEALMTAVAVIKQQFRP